MRCQSPVCSFEKFNKLKFRDILEVGHLRHILDATYQACIAFKTKNGLMSDCKSFFLAMNTTCIPSQCKCRTRATPSSRRRSPSSWHCFENCRWNIYKSVHWLFIVNLMFMNECIPRIFVDIEVITLTSTRLFCFSRNSYLNMAAKTSDLYKRTSEKVN